MVNLKGYKKSVAYIICFIAAMFFWLVASARIIIALRITRSIIEAVVSVQ